jgi:hypothetical protein
MVLNQLFNIFLCNIVLLTRFQYEIEDKLLFQLQFDHKIVNFAHNVIVSHINDKLLRLLFLLCRPVFIIFVTTQSPKLTIKEFGSKLYVTLNFLGYHIWLFSVIVIGVLWFFYIFDDLIPYFAIFPKILLLPNVFNQVIVIVSDSITDIEYGV